MDKSEFLAQFVYQPDKIRMLFDVPLFLQNATIEITQEEVSLRELLDFYVPKYKKEGKFDSRGIEEQITDPGTLPLAVNEAILDPEKWNLSIGSEKLPRLEQLDTVPIATDLMSGKTLLLDSNHTIISLVSKIDPDLLSEGKLTVVRIIGRGLEEIIRDFRILNRKE